MLVKIDRYRVRPDKIQQHRLIQERTRQLYHRYFQHPSLLLRSQDDPCQWISIHWYPDEETYHHRMLLVNSAPEMDGLVHAFQSVLDPDAPFIQEEYYDQVEVESLLSRV